MVSAVGVMRDWHRVRLRGATKMPSLFDNYRARCQRLETKKAKLRAKGILEGSSKWYKLLYR